MNGLWRYRVVVVLWLLLLFQNLSLFWSLEDEGLALLKFRERIEDDPYGALSNWKDDGGLNSHCSWFGVECSEGNVVVLNLKDLGLRGTVASDLGNLVHLKSIVFRNNSFYGTVPEEIAKLKELEMLDLRYNNFSGSLPYNLGCNLSLTILLLDNNDFQTSMSLKINELQMHSELQMDKSQLSDTNLVPSTTERQTFRNMRENSTGRKSLSSLSGPPRPPHIKSTHIVPVYPPPAGASSSAEVPSPAEAPSPIPTPSQSPIPAPSPSPIPAPSPSTSSYPPPAAGTSAPEGSPNSPSNYNHQALILSAAIVGPVLLLLLVIGIVFWKRNEVVTVNPWATGLSGQLQKAFVTGVPKLKRSELETACEDFSNVIGSSSACALYKGTLSSGVEIAVASLAVTTAKDWSNDLETQFRRKIDKLSKVNHKNFVNLLGYCEEEEPFTRMMVFEYAPNGTLFEHLHVKEAEHLDWGTRMRIAVGMAYCLDHMHQLAPPIVHGNLTSSAVYLTEDYASKISDFVFWNEVAASEMESNTESNVYSFGVILFEMVTGRLPYSVNSSSLDDWASDYLRGDDLLREMVDSSLQSIDEEQLERIGALIKWCVNPDPRRRPPMREISSRLREITGIGPDRATPRLSPLWWAELEIITTEAN